MVTLNIVISVYTTYLPDLFLCEINFENVASDVRLDTKCMLKLYRKEDPYRFLGIVRPSKTNHVLSVCCSF